jgi:hypothetical protein
MSDRWERADVLLMNLIVSGILDDYFAGQVREVHECILHGKALEAAGREMAAYATHQHDQTDEGEEPCPSVFGEECTCGYAAAEAAWIAALLTEAGTQAGAGEGV